MHGLTRLKPTQLLCVICTVCEQPGLFRRGPQLSSFLGLPSRRRCALAVALHRRDSWLSILYARNYPRTFDLHEIFKCARLKFTVYGRKHRYIHTTFANAVTLVQGSLRLDPTTIAAIIVVSLSNEEGVYFRKLGKQTVSAKISLYTASLLDVTVISLIQFNASLEIYHQSNST